MATIIQTPDKLSLSGNLKEIIISSAAKIQFTLKKGNDIVLDEVYSPTNGRINIDISEAVVATLATNVPTADLYAQSKAFGVFSILVNNVKSSTFTAINAGVENPANTVTNFLTANFLTWQPQEKEITYNQPEWLTYYFTKAAIVKVRFYFTDGSSKTVSIGNGGPGELLSFNLQMARVWPLGEADEKKRHGYYDVWVENAKALKFSSPQRYIYKADEALDKIFFCVNSLGGLDSFCFSGENKFIPEIEYKISSCNEELQADQPATTRIYSQNTGVLSARAAKQVWDFFRSSKAFYIQDGAIMPIVIDSSSIQSSNIESINSHEFQYRISGDRGLLNLTKSNNLPSNITIVSPDQELFFLEPRLIELPDAIGHEEFIIPVQSPFLEKWFKISLGNIKDWILALVHSSSTGQNSHKHNNKHVLDQFSEDGDGILSYRLDKILGLLRNDKRYLRKDKKDTAAEHITFKKGIEVVGEALIEILKVKGSMSSEDFVSGFLGGKGWAILWREFLNAAEEIERKACMELDEVTVRGAIRMYEFIMSQLSGENGSRIISDMMKVHSIDTAKKIIYLDTEDGLLFNPFEQGDILMVQQFMGMPSDSNNNNINKQYELVVSDAGLGPSKPTRIDWITYDYFVGDISQVAQRDTLVRVDSLFNLARKGIIKQTSAEPGSPYIDVIWGMKTDPDNALKARLGRLDGIIDHYWGRLKGFGFTSDNAYVRGDLQLRTGEDVRTTFEIIEGMLRSAMQSITYNLTEEDNFLTNATFTQNMEGWEHYTDIDLYSIDDMLIDMGTNFLSAKHNVSEMVEYDGRQMLRLKDGYIRQLNALIKPPGAESIIYLSFRYRCVSEGTLKVGFEGTAVDSAFSVTETLITPISEYVTHKVSGIWDGVGDFYLEFTGDIYIELLSFANHPLEDYKSETSTLFKQTDKDIKAVATGLLTLNQGILEAGWITAAEGNKLYASHKLEDGNEIISYINQTATTIAISAERIVFEGLVTANDNFKILADGSIETKNAKISGAITAGSIGGFEIANGRIGVVADKERPGGGLSITNDFFRVGSNNGYVMFGDDVMPGTLGGGSKAAGRIVNNHPENGIFPQTNYGLFVDVTGGAKNFGIMSNAAICAPAFINTRVSWVYPGGTYTMDLSQNTIFLLQTLRNCSINLPSRSQVCDMFGVSDLPSDFGTVFLIKIRADSKSVTLNGVYDHNEVLVNHRMASGDSVLILLSHRGMRYNLLNAYY